MSLKFPPANSCLGQEEAVHLYLDNELTITDRQAFETHLTHCPACQTVLAELQTLFTRLATLEEVDLPANITAQVMAHLPPSAPRPQYALIGHLALAGQAALGLLLIFFAWPLIASVANGQLAGQFWSSLSLMALSLNEWANSLAFDLSSQWRWSFNPNLAGYQIAPGPALTLAACLGLAWLVGNRVLLPNNPPSLKDGGHV